ncbi:major pollen allergen Ole e 10-like [Argentina anserina]|uniref:major pollen allergen Ole e 10-like n=1 Tax=Argentina anserina TaxID=57926 RepID=UPI00217675FD|nr:major pollen allergen Ole e 10-like [Potentilla anserina]
METKFVLVSLLLLQLSVTALSKGKGSNGEDGDSNPRDNPMHKPHGSHKTAHEPGGPAGGIAKPGSKPQVPFGGVDDPAVPTGGAAPAGGNKKWCIAKGGIAKSLLKKDFEDVCKEVDCSPTDGKGLCYTESIFAKASFAMNLKYQKNGKKDADCVYGGRAETTTIDPSWGKCILVSS